MFVHFKKALLRERDFANRKLSRTLDQVARCSDGNYEYVPSFIAVSQKVSTVARRLLLAIRRS